MYNQDSVIEERVNSLNNQLEKIQKDFRTNFQPKILAYRNNPLTKVMLGNIQMEINDFLKRNELGISVYVSVLNQNIVMLGVTLVDELVWEQIQ